jgi:hypothetical protein
MWRHLLLPMVAVGLFSGCVTQGRFVIPQDTQLEVYERPVTLSADGAAVMRPFFWTAAGMPPHSGVKYRLLKDGAVVQEGRLRAKFRPVSIFWPPFALIYWPMGLNPHITYDLVKGTQE